MVKAGEDIRIYCHPQTCSSTANKSCYYYYYKNSLMPQ